MTFLTGFDNREIGDKPIVSIGNVSNNQINLSWTSTANANEYYICRSENNSKYNCFEKTIETVFKDNINIKSGTKYKYVIVAKNENEQVISNETNTITTPFNDENKVAQDKDTLVFELIRLNNISTDNIISKLNLVSIGAYGSIITWSSTNENVLSSSSGIPNGTNIDTVVTLVASITSNNITATKQFSLTVLAKVDNTPISTTNDINIVEGTSLISINSDISMLPNEVQISWTIKDGIWSGYSKNSTFNKEIQSNGYSLLNSVDDSTGLIVVSNSSTTIKSTKNDTLTPTKNYPRGYSLHGTNNTIDINSITCDNHLSLGVVLKLEGNIWSIFMPNQTVPNMENFTYIYPNEGYMVWCYDENEY